MNKLIFLILTLFAHSAFATNDELVIVANKNSSISELSKYEVVGIYMGRFRASEQKLVVIPSDNQQLKSDFYSLLINKSLAQVNSYWSRLKFTGRSYETPIQLKNNQDVFAKLKANPNLIAYIPKTLVNDSVKVIYEVN